MNYLVETFFHDPNEPSSKHCNGWSFCNRASLGEAKEQVDFAFKREGKRYARIYNRATGETIEREYGTNWR